MATLYASAPGTTHTGTGTSGDPYDHIHDAFSALAEEPAGSELLLKVGTYTQSWAWNSVTWSSGSSGSPYIVRPETFTADTTKGVPGGTTAVTFRPSSGGAINFGVTSASYWSVRGITFDLDNVSSGNAGISMNYNSSNNEFRNCKFLDHGANNIGGGDLRVQAVELANSGNTSTLRNNAFRYCHFDYGDYSQDITRAVEHYFYIHSSGNIVEDNIFEGGTWQPAILIQFFATNSHFINDNVVRRNIFRNVGSSLAISSCVLFSQRCNRNWVYDNLFHDMPTRRAIDFRGGSGITGTTADNVAAYNTIVGCLAGIHIAEAAFTDTIIKKNIAYNNTTNYNDSGTSTSAAGNSFDGTNPVFTDLSGDDYTLSASSPAGLRAESTLVAVGDIDDVDITGATRDATEPSLGAYEYDAASTPEPPINVVPNPSGFTTNINTAVLMDGVTITDNNGTPLTIEAWLYADTGGTFTDVDTSGGATSVSNP